MNCPSCNFPVQPGAQFCDNCGASLAGAPAAPAAPPAGGVICSACGTPNIAGSMFCENCGQSLASQPAMPPVQQPPQQWQPAPAVPVQQPPQQWQQAPMPPAQQPPQQWQPAPAAPVQPPPQQWQPGPAVPVQQPPQQWPQGGMPVIGRLVIQAKQVNLPIPPGKMEILIGREDPVSNVFPEINLDPYDGVDNGVGRIHAKLTAMGGQVYIEDLNSVNKTRVRGQLLPPGQKQPLNNGDEIMLGKMKLIYYSS